MAGNLDLDTIATNQVNPEVPINDNFLRVDNALTDAYLIDLTSGNETITSDNYRENIRFLADNVATSGRTVTLPAIKRLVLIKSDSGNTHNITVIRGSTTFTLEPGEAALFYTDSTTDGLEKYTTGVTGAIPYDFGGFIPGLPTDGAQIFQLVAVRAFTLPDDLVGSQGYAFVDADATADFDLRKNNSSIGTMSFAAAANVATFTFTNPVSFAAGDRFSIIAPSPQDADLEDVSFTFLARR